MRLLILGAGAVTSELYAPALNSLGWAKDTTIVDPSATAIDLAKARLPHASFFQCEWEQALQKHRSGLDAAVVALPNHLHGKACRGCLESGLHVLCEKPLTLASDEADILDDLATQKNRLLAVGMVRRLVPAFKAIRQLIAEDVIGRVLSITVEDGDRYDWVTESVEPFRPENGGVLADIGIHYLDLIYSLLGKIEPDRYSDDSRGGVEANCDLRALAPNDVLIRLRLSRTRTLGNAIIITGEKGKVIQLKGVFDSCVLKTKSGGEGTFRIETPFASGPWLPTAFESCFAEQFYDFERGIQSGRYEQLVRGREAADSVRILEWCYEKRCEIRGPGITTGSPGKTLDSIVVTGGTGFIGTHLVRRLANQREANVRVLLRSFRRSAGIATHRVQMSRCDLLDAKAVKDSVRGAKFIFHLAYGRDGLNAERFTIESTQNIVEAAIEHQAECVVVLSTAWVFGLSRESVIVNESAPYKPFGGGYAKAKAEMERWCLARAHTSGKTRIVLLNPTCVFGPYGGAYTTLPGELAAKGQFCWINGGEGLANVVYVENLVDAMLLAARNDDVNGQRFLIKDATLTWRSFLERLLPAANYPSFSRDQLENTANLAQKRTIPALRDALTNKQLRSALVGTPPGKFAKRMLETLAPSIVAQLRNRTTGVPRLALNSTSRVHESPPLWLADLYGDYFTEFSSDKATRMLHWTPRINITDALDATARWLQEEDLAIL